MIDMAKTTKIKVTFQLHQIQDPYVQTLVIMKIPGPIFPHPGNMNVYSQKLFQKLTAAVEGMMAAGPN